MPSKIKSRITEEKFQAYIGVRDSGATNMFDVTMVCKLSGGMLDKEDCMDIMKNFGKYTKLYKIGNRG
jgi:hypothetical protein